MYEGCFMYTLFIDTHSEIIRVALVSDKVIQKEQESVQSHSVYLVPMIKEIMEENNITFNDIKNIVAINGPGSFTGIRIGLSVAKMISYSLKKPIYLISSLTALLVSSNLESDKLAVISDNKGFYVSVSDKDNKSILSECYLENIDELTKKYDVVGVDYDIYKIVSEALKGEEINVHSVKANYVKSIVVSNDRK